MPILLFLCIALAGCGREPQAATKDVPTDESVSAIVIHAAQADVIEPPFVLVEDATAADGQALAAPPKAGDAPGAAHVAFQIPRDGVYSIWVRVFWGTDGETACSNSLSVQLDGDAPVDLQDGTYESWHWLPLRRSAGIPLTAGAHALLFRNREDGIKFDQIFITPWHEDELARRVPQGIE